MGVDVSFQFSIAPLDSCQASKESMNQAEIMLNVLEGHMDKVPCLKKKLFMTHK